VSKSGRIAAGVAGTLLLLLVLAQLLLPRIAANRISARLSRYGTVESVSVSAWPALKLLWHSADSVTVRARSLNLTAAQTATLLWEARRLDRIDLTASSMTEGPLRLSAVSIHKRAKSLTGQAKITATDVDSALPEGFGSQLLSSERGEVKVRVSGGLFGVGGSVDAIVQASEGKLIARPIGFPLDALSVTLFSEPHIYLQGVGARAESGPGGSLSYQLAVLATLR
jgi:LmeA-like phospholipid-binding